MRTHLIACLALALVLPACDSDFPSSEGRAPIDRATFVETFVELRLAAIDAGSTSISEADRERVLSERGVSEDDLRAFIEVHGRNVPYMNEVWREIEEKLEAARAPDEVEGEPQLEVRTPGS